MPDNTETRIILCLFGTPHVTSTNLFHQESTIWSCLIDKTGILLFISVLSNVGKIKSKIDHELKQDL